MANKFPIFDAHEDIAFHLSYFKRDFVEPKTPCMITLPGLKKGNIKFVLNTIFVHPKLRPEKTTENANLQFQVYENIYRDFDSEIIKVQSKQDIDTAISQDKIGFITLMEGADPLQKPQDLYEYYDKGLRVVGPSWNNANLFASGPATEDGLTEQGYELINIMNELNITLDLSHLNQECFWNSLENYKHIPIASHSNARALTDHPRNLYDEQLKEISERGGMIGIVLYNSFLKTTDNIPTLEDIYKHIDHILNICGEDHVGIGSDLDGAEIKDFPEDIRAIENLQKIPEYLYEKGYSKDLVRKISYDNFLRVIKSNLR
ncbi:MAG TPA: membrane dipeptidase [Thermodesulfobacteriota bacterium]|nr:membrane dipeptidase [Thermodesulfobacteriota bacterium]